MEENESTHRAGNHFARVASGGCATAAGRSSCVDDDAVGANDGLCWTDVCNFAQHGLAGS